MYFSVNVEKNLVPLNYFLFCFPSMRKIFLHGNNLNSLHQLIYPECLPSEFGGTLPPYDMGMWARTLLGPDYSDETEYTHTYDALHVKEALGRRDRECGDNLMKRWESVTLRSESPSGP